MSDYLKEEENVEELIFKGEKVKLKSPGMKAFPDFLKVAKDLSRAGDDANTAEMMKCFSDESIQSMTNLINLTLKKSFPNEDKEEVDTWAMENNMILMGKVIKLCSPKQSRDNSAKDKIKERLANRNV